MSDMHTTATYIPTDSLTLSQENDDHVIFNQPNQKRLAWDDILLGLKKWPIWLMLSYQDIKLRYRRSVLGPFWITLSMAITVYTMGYLYAHIFHMELEQYFPYLVSGMLSWSLISTIVLEYTDGFMAYDTLIKQIKLPYTLYIHRIASRNIIIFFHNIVVIIPILAIYHTYAKVNFHTLLLIPGLLAVYINAVSYGLILAMIGARYRDVSQIIKSLVQVIFFVTPVMWKPEVLGENRHLIVDLNPFYAFLEIIRQPLIGGVPTIKNIVMVIAVTAIGLVFSYKMLARYRSRIVYWL